MADRTQAAPEVRLPALDGLRGLAVLLVMAHHLWVLKPVNGFETACENVAALGMFGVDLFFVLSGFLITGILLKTKEGPGYFRNFYARRTLRIMPLFFLVVGVCLLGAVAATLLPSLGSKLPQIGQLLTDWPWYAGFASNVLFTLRCGFQHPILNVTWSLAIEEQFYLLWPLVVWLMPRRPLRWVCVAVIAASAAARVTACASGWYWVQVYVFTPCRMDGLALGALIATFWSADLKLPSWLSRTAWAACVGGTLVLIGLFAAGVTMSARGMASQLYYPLASVVAVSGLLLALSAAPGGLMMKLLAGRFLMFFGKYSYAIYLLHYPVQMVFRTTLLSDERLRSWLPPLAGQALFYLVAGAAVVPLALLSWRFVEAPCLRLKRYFEYPASPKRQRGSPSLALRASPEDVTAPSGTPRGRTSPSRRASAPISG